MKVPVSPVTPTAAGARGPVDGRSSRWAAHREARRAELIEAALLAVGTHGASVGMDQIAAVARTSKPVIYRYFTDKTDLYRAVSERVVGEVVRTLAQVAATHPPPRELLHASVEAYVGLLEQNPQVFRFLARHPAAGQAPELAAAVAALLSTQLTEHLDAAGLDPRVARPWGPAIVGFISAASLWWLEHPDEVTREELADYLGALLWGGVAGVYEYLARDQRTPGPGTPGPGPGR